MMSTSHSCIRASSTVAASLPCWTRGPSRASGTSHTWDRPAFTAAARAASTSNPVTRNPASANSTAVGRPT